MAVQPNLFEGVEPFMPDEYDYQDEYEPESNDIIIENTLSSPVTKDDQIEREIKQGQLQKIEDGNNLAKLEQSLINPLQTWTAQQAQAYFDTVTEIQTLIDKNIDKSLDQMTIQGNTFDVKSGLEKIIALTGIIPRYQVLGEDYSSKNACVKYTVKCIVTTKNNIPIGVGVGTCSSFDNKEAYTWSKEKDIPRWRFENRTVDGNRDSLEPKRIYDAPNDIWISLEDLENRKETKWQDSRKIETGEIEYKIPYTSAEYRENQHKIYRKAHIRALREAISYALNRGTHNKKTSNNTNSSTSKKTDFTCNECGKKLSENEAKYSKVQCYKCKLKAGK